MQQHLIGRSRLAWVQLVHSRLTPAKKVLDTWNIAPPRTIISININTLTPAKKVLDNSNITLLTPFVTCISQQLKLNSMYYLKITWKTTSSNHQSHFHPNILAPTVVVLALLPPSNHQILVYLLIS